MEEPQESLEFQVQVLIGVLKLCILLILLPRLEEFLIILQYLAY